MPNSRISDLTKLSSLDQNTDAEALLLMARSKSHNETINYQDFKSSITDYSVLTTGDQSVAGIKTFTDDAVFDKNVAINGHLSVKGDIFNLRFQEGIDPSTLTAWQAGVYSSGSNVEHNGKSWQSTSDAIDSDEPGVANLKSTASITVVDFSRIINGDSVELIAQDGTIFQLIEGQHWSIGASNEITATNIATAIFNQASSHFTASSAANSDLVTIEQLQAGVAGNTSITIVTSVDPNLMSKFDFSGGTGSAVNPWQDITLKDADQFLTELDSNLDTKGNLTVGGAADLKSTLSVTSSASLLDILDVTGNTTLQSNLDVAGNVNLQSNLDVIGNTTLSDTIVNGDLTINGTNTYIYANLEVTEHTKLNTLTVDGITQLNENLTVTASEARFIVDNAVFEKDVEIQGDLSVKGDLFNLKFDDGSGGNADSYLTQLDSNLVTKGTLSVDLDSTLNSNLDVTGQTTILDKLGIGITNPQKTLEVAGNLRTTKTTVDGGVLSLDLNSGGSADHPKLSLYDKNGGNPANLLYSRLQFTRDAEAFISSKSDLKLVTNGEDRITITADGDVGIGTTNPTEIFQIGEGNSTQKDLFINFKGHVSYEQGLIFRAQDNSKRLSITANLDPSRNNDTLSIRNHADVDLFSVGPVVTTVSNNLIANGGAVITSNEDNDTPELTLRRASSVNASGTDDIVDIRVADSSLNFIINNDSDGDSGNYFFRRMAGGQEVLGSINCSTITTDNIIRKDGDTNTYLQFHEADQFRVVTGGFERLEVTNQHTKAAGDLLVDGNVGIGTTTPGRRLDVKGSAQFSVNTPSHETFIFTTQAVDDAKLLMQNSSAETAVQLSANGDTFFNGGKVGIGTLEPKAKLQVNGDILFGDGAAQPINPAILPGTGFANGGDWHIGLASHGGNVLNGDGSTRDGFTGLKINSYMDTDNSGVIDADESEHRFSQDLEFYTHEYQDGLPNGLSMVIKNNGNVGIGVDLDSTLQRAFPRHKLHVVGDGYFAGDSIPNIAPAAGVYLGKSESSSDHHVSIISSDNRSGYIDFSNTTRDAIGRILYANSDSSGQASGQGMYFYSDYIDSSEDPDLTIKPNGNVGIATTRPDDKLHVNGNIVIGPSEPVVNGSVYSYIRPKYAGAAIKMGTNNNAWDRNLHFGHHDNIGNFVERVTILMQNGNVGIGTASPGYKLHIVETSGATGEDATPSMKIEGSQPRIWLRETDETNLNTLIRNNNAIFEIDTVSDTDQYIENRFAINHANGNVRINDLLGIGKDPDGYHLDVAAPGTFGNGIRIQTNEAAADAITHIGGGGSGDVKFNVNGLGDVAIAGTTTIEGTTTFNGLVVAEEDVTFKSSFIQEGVSRFKSALVLDFDILGGNTGNDLNIYTNSETADVNLGAGNTKNLITLEAQKAINPATGAESGQDILFNNSNVGINVPSVELSPVTQDKFKMHIKGEVKIDGRLFATDVFETYPVIPRVGDVHQGGVVVEPTAPYAAGDMGTLIYTENFLYICIDDSDGSDPNKVAWKRMPISEW